MTAYTEFYSTLRVEVSGECPDPILLNALQRAGRNFSQRSRLLVQDHAQIAMAPNVLRYQLTKPSGYDIADVVTIRHNGNRRAWRSLDDIEALKGYHQNWRTETGDTPDAYIRDISGTSTDFWIRPVPYTTKASSTGTITAITQANPCQVTIASHGLTTGKRVYLASIVGMTELNTTNATITKVDDNNFTLDGVDSTSYTAYTSGGTATTSDDVTELTIAVMPLLTATEIDSLVYDHCFDTLIEGAKAILFAQQTRSWGNAVMAVDSRKRFDEGVLDAQRMRDRGFGERREPFGVVPHAYTKPARRRSGRYELSESDWDRY